MINQALVQAFAREIVKRDLKGEHDPKLRDMLIKREANRLSLFKVFDTSDIPAMLKAHKEACRPKSR